MKTTLFLLLLTCAHLIHAQLQNGPMLGYVNHREAAIWVQTQDEAKVEIIYQSVNTNKTHIETAQTLDSQANTATIIADSLQPGTTYQYQIKVNDQLVGDKDRYFEFSTQKLWQWREEPPEWKMALGSCTYINEKQYDRPGEAYGGDYSIFNAIHGKDPDIMLWLGDNIYMREVDFYGLSGYQKRYTHTRDIKPLQKLLAHTHHYAIWDDHDYGPNNSDRSNIHKYDALAAFKQFWANPTYGFDGNQCAVTQFKYNDAEFFLLDDRWFRSPNNRKTGNREYLGEKQMQWLIDALVTSKATFKFVAIGGQVLSNASLYENYATYPKERAQLLDLLVKEELKNVIFLTGDRHKTELSKIKRNGIVFYDLTVSPLTSTAYDSSDEPNKNRVEGTHYAERNFGIIEFSGDFKNRQLKMIIFDKQGNKVWTKTLDKQ
ncbi:MAG: alkaline phosphatase D family protein [Psychroflexus sp.]|nr:alkaline phosphatase D family protein [Psychroflexus sp.]